MLKQDPWEKLIKDIDELSKLFLVIASLSSVSTIFTPLGETRLKWTCPVQRYITLLNISCVCRADIRVVDCQLVPPPQTLGWAKGEGIEGVEEEDESSRSFVVGRYCFLFHSFCARFLDHVPWRKPCWSCNA